MRINRRILQNVIDAVYESPFGVTLEDLVSRTGHHRLTLQRYVSYLESLGIIYVRKLGNYTLIFPRSIAEFIRYDYPTSLICSMLKAILDQTNVDLVDLGYRVAKYFSRSIIDIIRSHIDLIKRQLGKLTNIYFPTTSPIIRARLEILSKERDIFILELSGMELRNISPEIFCHFMKGYILGILEELDIPTGKIELIEVKDSEKTSCTYLVKLNKPLIDLIREP